MKHRRHGYSLLEMVAALSLLTVFLLLAGQLVKQVTIVQRVAADMEWSVSRMDFALRALRGDVWTTSSITLEGEGQLVLRMSGQAVRWVYTSEPSVRYPGRGWLIRHSDGVSQAVGKTDQAAREGRYEVPLGVRFSNVSASGLEIAIDGQTIWLPGQVILARGADGVARGAAP